MASSLNRTSTSAHPEDKGMENVGGFAGNIVGEFSKTARSFDVQAATLKRGLHTALFVQQFKKGLLTFRERE